MRRIEKKREYPRTLENVSRAATGMGIAYAFIVAAASNAGQLTTKAFAIHMTIAAATLLTGFLGLYTARRNAGRTEAQIEGRKLSLGAQAGVENERHFDHGSGPELDLWEGEMIIPANSLPKGYVWDCFDDGSGDLKDPNGEWLVQYDLLPYANVGGIEHKFAGECWDVFYGDLEEFKEHAEAIIRHKLETEPRMSVKG